jgi:hypothetical protein
MRYYIRGDKSAVTLGFLSPFFVVNMGSVRFQVSLVVQILNAAHFGAEIIIPRLSRYSSIPSDSLREG